MPEESWLKIAAEQATVAIVAYNDYFLYGNAEALRLLEYSMEELRAMHPWDVVPVEDLDQAKQRTERRLHGDPMPVRTEARLRSKSGQDFWVEASVTTVSFQGAPAVLATVYDITQRKRAEEALRNSEERYRLFFEGNPHPMWVYDIETYGFLAVNDAAVAHYGYSREEFLRRTILDIRPPEDVERLKSAVAALGEGGTDPEIWRHVRKDGAVFEVEITGAPIDLGGRPARLVLANDITERRRAEAALRLSEERLQLAQRAARSVTWEWDLPTDAVTLSEFAREILGALPDEVPRTSREFLNLIHPDDHPVLAEAIRETFKFDTDLDVETRILLPNGEVRWVAETARAMRDASGRVVRLVGVARDVTERRRTQQALRDGEERYRLTLAAIGDGVIRTDAAGRIDYINPAAEALTGWRAADALGLQVAAVFRPADADSRQPLPDPVERCLREGRTISPPGKRLLLNPDGTTFVIRDSASPIRDAAGELIGAILVFKDTTELYGMERALAHMASYDPLTGLLNRRQFEREIERVLATIAVASGKAKGHTLLYLDLDDFKVINDTCGHVAGDELLKQVSSLLREAVPEGSPIARLGGDEFGVLIENRPAAEAREIAERIQSEIGRFRFNWHGRAVEITVSSGLVPVAAETGDLTELMIAADAACYAAKERGRHRIHVYQPDDRALVERSGGMQWIHRIHRALDEERFRLYHQPIQSLAAGPGPNLSEVVIRMLDEGGEIVAPMSFIPAAERYHLMPAIDRWVVRTALEALASNGHRADSRAFTINLSGQSFVEDDMFDFVLDTLEASGVATERVYFEITETAAITNLRRAMSFIASLQAVGCRFVLDDFGTGFSTFAYLKNLPVDFLKIDGEFVRDLCTNPVHQAIVESIHQIGRALGIRTIAEGVEDDETLRALTSIGVDFAQGFVIARPEPLR